MWQAEYGDIPAEYFVWLDESSVDDRTDQRNQGWADLGRACVHRATFIQGQHYSILPALTADGFIALDIFEGLVNKDRFLQFLNDNLVCTKLLMISGSFPILKLIHKALKLNPYPGVRSVVVMDNCAIHHDEEVWAIVEGECGMYCCSHLLICTNLATGAKLIYLPPYSPDFNPIEQAFHSVKAWLQRHEAEAVLPEAHPWLI